MARGKKTGKGLFITLEGGDGVGKSTQITLLKEHLQELGYQVISTREPGGTDKAEKIREFILSGQAEAMGPEMETTLFAAARLDHVENLIAPALEEGKVVLCDRFADSTRVYQGNEGTVDEEFLNTLELLIKDIAWPDVTLILDLDHSEGGKRMAARRDENDEPDRFEKEAEEVQKNRREAFLEIAKSEPRRCKVVDAAGDPQEVQQRIQKVVVPLVKRRLGTGNG